MWLKGHKWGLEILLYVGTHGCLFYALWTTLAFLRQLHFTWQHSFHQVSLLDLRGGAQQLQHVVRRLVMTEQQDLLMHPVKTTLWYLWEEKRRSLSKHAKLLRNVQQIRWFEVTLFSISQSSSRSFGATLAFLHIHFTLNASTSDTRDTAYLWEFKHMYRNRMK